MNSKGKSRSGNGLPKFIDAIKIHIPEEWIIVEMGEEAFRKGFFFKNSSVIRSGTAFYWLNNEYQLVFCCKRNGSNENSHQIR